MHQDRNIFSKGAEIVRRNQRYVWWFYVVNLVLAVIGTGAFMQNARAILDHSLFSDRLVHRFSVFAYLELLSRPEFGPARASTVPSIVLALLFVVLTLIFLPGVLLGYASDHRISRGEFFRGCGQNVWRFVRLSIVFAILSGIVVGILSALQDALVNAADNTSYETLPFWVQTACLVVILLMLTFFRIWFDLAEIDVVLTDQKAVRRSIGYGWRWTRKNLGRLLGSYVAINLIGLATLAAGVWFWNVVVPPANVVGAFLVGQVILLLFLAMRFWQRATAVAFYIRGTVDEEADIPTLPVMPTTAVSQGGGI